MYKRSFVIFKKNNTPVELLYRLLFGYWAMEKNPGAGYSFPGESTKLNFTILMYFMFFLLPVTAMFSFAEGRAAPSEAKGNLWSFTASQDTGVIL